MRFLVVDDSTTMRRILVNSLKSLGHNDIVEAGDGREALTKCDGTVTLVLTDWNMPNMSGLEFVRALRTNPATQGLPVIMVTTSSATEDIKSAVEAGIQDYILKPFTPEALRDKIARVLGAAAA